MKRKSTGRERTTASHSSDRGPISSYRKKCKSTANKTNDTVGNMLFLCTEFSKKKKQINMTKK